METHTWDAVIIGGGTAGLSAAQMLGRARRRTLVIDGGEPRNRFAAHMHGVLGHDGTDPADLLARGRAEAAAYGVAIDAGRVSAVRDLGEALEVERADGRIDRARAVVVATGIRDVLPEVTGLAEHWGSAVLHCPYCHGWEVADRRLGVLATSPASIHQIELIRQWSDDVTAFVAAVPLAPEVEARLLARGIRVVTDPVVAAVTEDGVLTALTDATGRPHPVDAVFAAPAPDLALDFLDGLALARTDDPGAPIAVDARGASSHPRVFAAGNAVAPYANVPVSMGSGSMAGAGVNATLVAEDVARAVDARRHARNVGWEERYAERDRFWSGRVNATTAAVIERLFPDGGEGRRVLDVGCGEGADAVWLAEHGWTVTALDVSPTAIRRGSDAAAERGIPADRLRFAAVDAVDALPDGDHDLVVSSFLHSWEADFPRIAVLRDAAARVAPGGHLLAVSHAAAPPWAAADHSGHDHPVLRRPEEEWALLALDAASWELVTAETRERETVGPDGEPATLEDGVLLVRRRS